VSFAATSRAVRNFGPDPTNVTWPRWLRIGFWFCTVIAVAVVLRRLFALASPPHAGPPQLVALDAVFASHAGLTLAHILPALAFVVLTPLVFMRRFTRSNWPERLLFPLGAVVGGTAYAMSVYSVGGWLERSAVLLFNTLFLVSLAQAYRYSRQGEPVLKLRWLLLAIGILLGIATTRPVMGFFFATSRLTHLKPHQFFGIAFWIGFSINTIAVGSWLGSERAKSLLESWARYG
jgi:hypothetical protein